MHLGRFQEEVAIAPVRVDVPMHEDAPVREGARSHRKPLLDRRSFLFLGLGLTGGAALPLALGWPAGGSKPVDGERGSLAWALALEHASDEQLLRAAGDFERVAARHTQDARLAPIAERILEVALRVRVDPADAAGACAVRSLDLLGHREQLLARRRDILDAEGLPQLREELLMLRETPEKRR